MKSALTFLLAFAAAAHAQFAVMHSNGVVTSPTNLTIQQSNVAGLSNALAGKLATNGSAVGLTGFVGTTNAETARGNLGISNTFAGQFHADFHDDFSQYTNGTIVGDGFTPLRGGAYTMRWSGQDTNNSPLIVSNGTVASTNGEIFYLTSELDRPVYNFGAVVEFDQSTASNAITILIQPDTVWIGRVLHIVVTPWTVVVDVSTNGVAGFGGTNTIIFTNYAATTPMLTNTRQNVIGNIEGDTLHLRVGGHVYSASHPDIPLVVGPYFTFESFYLTNTLTNRWHKVWANSQTMADIYSQPFSEELKSLARGYGDFSTRLIVATNPQSFIPTLSTNASAYFDKSILVNGLVRGKRGTNSFLGLGAPMVSQKTGGSVGNTNTTNLTVLKTLNVLSGFMDQNYSRWQATIVGSFANNTNEKRLVFDMAGNHIDTGNITNSGEWILEAIVYRTETNSHEGFAILKGEGFTETARWAFNNGSGVQFNVDIEASATSNNQVILRGAWADWYP